MADNYPATGPLTLDDVRRVLADTDPNSTNAGALRARLGRGSVSTIQKHLDRIRADLLPAPEPVGGAPEAPAEAITALWSVAWSAAQAQVLGRLNVLTLERDAAQTRANALSSDLAAANGDVDKLSEELEKAAATIATATTLAASTTDRRVAEAAETTREFEAKLNQAMTELEHERLACVHAAELAARDAELKDRAHQQDREHLLNQIAELKSALHRPAS